MEKVGYASLGDWNAGYFILPVGLGAYFGGFWAGFSTLAILVGYSDLYVNQWLGGPGAEGLEDILCVVNLLVAGLFVSALTGRLHERRERAEESSNILEEVIRVKAGLAAIVDSSDDAIISKSITGKILSWNRGAESVFGYPANEAIGREITMLLPASRIGEEAAILAQILEGRVVRHFETVRVRKDGRMIDVSVTISPIRDAKGRVVGASKIARDITDRKAAELALKASEERYHTTLDNIMEGCQLIGSDWRYLYLNDAAAGHNRRPNSELLGRSMLEAWPGMDGTEAYAVMKRCMEQRVRAHVEVPFAFPDGHHGWFDMRCQPVPEGLFLLSIDITDRKRAELGLASEKNLLRTLVDQLPEIVHVVGPDGRILLANAAMAESLGFDDPKALVGKTRADLELVDPLGSAADEAQVLAGKSLRDREEFMLTAGGTRTFLTTRLPLRSGEGDVTGAIGIARDITRLKEMNAIVQRQAQIVETMNEACYALDSQWRFTFVNDRSVELLKHTREQMLGRSIWNVFSVVRGTPTETYFRTAMEERRAITFETFSPVAKRWLDVRLFPSGEGVAVFLLDIQARKEAESGLKLFRVLMDRTRECIEVVDPSSGRFVDVNEAACKQHGYTKEEYLRLTVLDVHPSMTGEVFDSINWKLRETGGMLLNANHRRKNGTEFPVELSLNWVTLERDYIVAVARDVSERAQAETALRLSEERFRQVVENIHEVFWLTDVAKGRMLYISPGYERIWGRSCQDLYESPQSWIETVHADDRERVRARASERQASGEYDETYRIVRPDGALRWIRDRAFPVRDDHGRVVRIVGVAEDITAGKRMEDQFLHKQRLEAVGTLSSGIAHDLNNILTPMLLVGPSLREKLVAPEDLQLIDHINQSAQRGANIVKQLLTFSRGVTVNYGVVQVSHLLREMVALMRETFPREIDISDSTGPRLWPVKGDATQLHQVLMNLCLNARDAMPEGGQLSLGACNATIEPGHLAQYPQAKVGSYVVLSVSDTGVGIPADHLQKIFEPFFTTKELGKGTGLGLSSVLGIVKSHEGFLTVYSEPGRGSLFKAYIPADPDCVEAPVEPAKAVARGSGQLILVVDDEAAIRVTTARVLEQHGFLVLTACDGAEGAKVAAAHRADLKLVITDLMMPKAGGVELIRGLRQFAPEIPAIAASGLDDIGRRQELQQLGVHEILAKPLTPAALLGAVSRQLRS